MLDFSADFINITNTFLGQLSVQATGTEYSFTRMVANLKATAFKAKDILFSISYVCGIFFVMSGVLRYRIFANQTFGSAQRGEMAGPMVHIMVGAVLIYFPSAINVSLITVFGTDTILDVSSMLGYAEIQRVVQWQEITTLIVWYLHLVGIIAFLRGWVILSKMAHPGSQPGSVGKGITHIVGGILLINIVATMKIVASTLGYA